MKKRVFPLVVFLTIMLIGLINAAPFSLGSLFDGIAEGNLIILLVFIISFAVLFFAFSKALFKGNIAIAAIISFALSFGITYWVNKADFDLGGWIYDIGISTETLALLIPILATALAVFLIIKLRKDSLFIFGGFLLASSLFVYEKVIVIVLGIILILIRLFIGRRRGEKAGRGRYPKANRGRGPMSRESGRERDPRMKHYLKRLHKRKQRQLKNLSGLRRRSRYHDMSESIKDELRAIERKLGMH